LNPYIAFDGIAIFTILILSIHECGSLSIFLCFLQFLSSVFYIFIVEVFYPLSLAYSRVL
jgi:hypothetical protein